MLSQLSSTMHVVGIKQSQKAIRDGFAIKVFLARDAESRIVRPIELLCQENQVEVIMVDTMKELGQAVGIDVGATVVAILRNA